MTLEMPRMAVTSAEDAFAAALDELMMQGASTTDVGDDTIPLPRERHADGSVAHHVCKSGVTIDYDVSEGIPAPRVMPIDTGECVREALRTITSAADDARLVVSAVRLDPLSARTSELSFAGRHLCATWLPEGHMGLSMTHFVGCQDLMSEGRDALVDAILLVIICAVTGMRPHRVTRSMGQLRLYQRDMPLARAAASRFVPTTTRPQAHIVREVTDVTDVRFDDVRLTGLVEERRVEIEPRPLRQVLPFDEGGVFRLPYDPERPYDRWLCVSNEPMGWPWLLAAREYRRSDGVMVADGEPRSTGALEIYGLEQAPHDVTAEVMRADVARAWREAEPSMTEAQAREIASETISQIPELAPFAWD